VPWRVTAWPDTRFERLYGDEWIPAEPSESALASAAQTLSARDWATYLDFTPAEVRAINRVGLERNGFTAEQLDRVKQIHRLLYRDGLISKEGTVTASSGGGAWVFGRFDKFTAGAEIIVLPESNDFTWPDAVTPLNFIDDAVFSRLRQLQIPPSLPASLDALLGAGTPVLRS
jgi:hypothetical protein